MRAVAVHPQMRLAIGLSSAVVLVQATIGVLLVAVALAILHLGLAGLWLAERGLGSRAGATIVENIALSAVTRRYPAGATIVTEHRRGDTFHAIEGGIVEMWRAGRAVRRAREGDSFGELALLRDVPGPETVLARAPVTVVTIGRDRFLGAIGSQPDGTPVAETALTPRGTDRSEIGDRGSEDRLAAVVADARRLE